MSLRNTICRWMGVERASDAPSSREQHAPPPCLPDHEWPGPPPQKYEWPYTAPDAPGEITLGMAINDIQYKKVKTEDGQWKWVVNQDAMDRIRQYQRRKSELFMALQTRVVTDDEMDEILRYGEDINIRNMTSYNAEDKRRERADAFVTQARLRTASR